MIRLDRRHFLRGRSQSLDLFGEHLFMQLLEAERTGSLQQFLAQLRKDILAVPSVRLFHWDWIDQNPQANEIKRLLEKAQKRGTEVERVGG